MCNTRFPTWKGTYSDDDDDDDCDDNGDDDIHSNNMI